VQRKRRGWGTAGKVCHHQRCGGGQGDCSCSQVRQAAGTAGTEGGGRVLQGKEEIGGRGEIAAAAGQVGDRGRFVGATQNPRVLHTNGNYDSSLNNSDPFVM